jgi:hypothetical protein
MLEIVLSVYLGMGLMFSLFMFTMNGGGEYNSLQTFLWFVVIITAWPLFILALWKSGL